MEHDRGAFKVNRATFPDAVKESGKTAKFQAGSSLFQSCSAKNLMLEI
jgi:hypothetical protein